jgi:spore coat polysaccharide biosynthesis predicted glycosyltransferase SpsG
LVGLSPASKSMLPASETHPAKSKIIIADSPLAIDTLLESAKKQGQKTVTLDWFGATLPHINIAVFAHSEVKAIEKSYTGFEYIIIRNEITALPKQTSSRNKHKVLVCLGGGDLLGQGFETATYLSEQGFEVVLVQGPLAKQIPSTSLFTTHVNPPKFPEN